MLTTIQIINHSTMEILLTLSRKLPEHQLKYFIFVAIKKRNNKIIKN